MSNTTALIWVSRVPAVQSCWNQGGEGICALTLETHVTCLNWNVVSVSETNGEENKKLSFQINIVDCNEILDKTQRYY